MSARSPPPAPPRAPPPMFADEADSESSDSDDDGSSSQMMDPNVEISIAQEKKSIMAEQKRLQVRMNLPCGAGSCSAEPWCGVPNSHARVLLSFFLVLLPSQMERLKQRTSTRMTTIALNKGFNQQNLSPGAAKGHSALKNATLGVTAFKTGTI